MKINKNTKMLIIGTFILVMGIVLVIIGNSIATPNSTVLRDQEVDNLQFKNANLEYKNDISTYTVEVINLLESSYNLKYVNIKLTGDNNTYTLVGYIGENIGAGETRKITASIDKDITNINDIEYSIVK